MVQFVWNMIKQLNFEPNLHYKPKHPTKKVAMLGSKHNNSFFAHSCSINFGLWNHFRRLDAIHMASILGWGVHCNCKCMYAIQTYNKKNV